MTDASEVALLTAVRTKLRANMTGWRDVDINVEEDPMNLPQSVTDRYIAICPAGARPGPTNDTNELTSDMIWGISISVVMRISGTPRDAQRQVTFLDNNANLNNYLFEANSYIQNQHDVVVAANAIIVTQEGGDVGGIIRPLRFQSISPKPIILSASSFRNAPVEETRAGVLRTITYGGARRLKNLV